MPQLFKVFQNALGTQKKWVFSLLTVSIFNSFFSFSTAEAQQFKVEKVKGNKAVIEYSGTTLSPGGTYAIGGAQDEEGAISAGHRKYIIGGSVSLEFFTDSSSLASSTSTKDNEMEFLGRFGWNLENYELGFIFGYTSNETDSSAYSAISGGGFFDYNFTPNRPGTSSILGLAAESTYTSITSSTGGSGMGVTVSGFMKWFTLGPSTALRLDAGYFYGKSDFNTYTTTTQGFDVRGGLVSYF